MFKMTMEELQWAGNEGKVDPAIQNEYLVVIAKMYTELEKSAEEEEEEEEEGGDEEQERLSRAAKKRRLLQGKKKNAVKANKVIIYLINTFLMYFQADDLDYRNVFVSISILRIKYSKRYRVLKANILALNILILFHTVCRGFFRFPL
jgi:hypothetical protein